LLAALQEEAGLPVQERLYRNLKLWSFYVDLEERWGGLECMWMGLGLALSGQMIENSGEGWMVLGQGFQNAQPSCFSPRIALPLQPAQLHGLVS
jgi:hypothetical protein